MTFVVPQPLQITSLAFGRAGELLSFPISSSAGPIRSVAFSVLQVTNPEQANLTTTDMTVRLRSGDSVDMTGAPVAVSLNGAAFSSAGDYHVVLLARGKTSTGQAVVQAIPMVIRRPPLVLNVEEAAGQTIELSRPAPFCTATKTAYFYIGDDKTGLLPADIRVSGDQIYRKDSKVLVEGEAFPCIVAGPGAGPCLPAKSADRVFTGGNLGSISRGRDSRLCIRLHLWGISETGAFTTKIVVTSSRLLKPVSIPLVLTVTDQAWLPFLTLLAGVVGGAALSYLAQNWRPRRILLYSILQLQGAVRQFQKLVTQSEKVEKLKEIRDELARAADAVELKDVEGAKAVIETANAALQTFGTDEAAENERTRTAFNILQADVDHLASLRGELTLSDENLTEDATDLNAIAGQLPEVDQLLLLGRVDEAAESVRCLQGQITALTKRSLERKLTEVREYAHRRLPARDKRIEAVFQEAEGLIEVEDFDGARRLMQKVTLEITNTTPRYRRDPRQSLQEDEAQPPSFQPSAEQAVQVTRIELSEPPVRRAAGAALTFRIVDSGSKLLDGDIFEWDFDDSPPRHLPSETIHRFATPDVYRVSVNVKRGSPAETVFWLFTSVTVLPTLAEVERRKLKNLIRSADWAVSGTALILATLTGILYTYTATGKTFGSLSDYFLAFLWGFGVDNSIRGFAEILGKTRGAAS